MGFVLAFCLAFSERECKGIIYYTPFRICQMLHILCNYHTFGKLFLPTHMLGKSSNCGRETFLHKVNFLCERNCELHRGLTDLRALLSSLGLILPRNPELARLPPWEAEPSALCFTRARRQRHWTISQTGPQCRCVTTKASTHPCTYNGFSGTFARLASMLPSLVTRSIS